MLWFLLLSILTTTTLASNIEFCELCGGNGNFIADGKAVIEFEFRGQTRRFNCQNLQDRLEMNAESTFSDPKFCDYIFPIAVQACKCSTPVGDMLADLLKPTPAPAAVENSNNQEGDGGKDGGTAEAGGGNAEQVEVLPGGTPYPTAAPTVAYCSICGDNSELIATTATTVAATDANNNSSSTEEDTTMMIEWYDNRNKLQTYECTTLELELNNHHEDSFDDDPDFCNFIQRIAKRMCPCRELPPAAVDDEQRRPTPSNDAASPPNDSQTRSDAATTRMFCLFLVVVVPLLQPMA